MDKYRFVGSREGAEYAEGPGEVVTQTYMLGSALLEVVPFSTKGF